jgi:cytochrome c peroxidase
LGYAGVSCRCIAGTPWPRITLPWPGCGLKLFVGEERCFLCHAGPLFTNGAFGDVGKPFLPQAASTRAVPKFSCTPSGRLAKPGLGALMKQHHAKGHPRRMPLFDASRANRRAA